MRWLLMISLKSLKLWRRTTSSLEEKTSYLILISKERSMRKNKFIQMLLTCMIQRKKKCDSNSLENEHSSLQNRSLRLQMANSIHYEKILKRVEKSQNIYLKNWKLFLREQTLTFQKYEKKLLILDDSWVRVRTEKLESMMQISLLSTWKINSDKRKRLLQSYN